MLIRERAFARRVPQCPRFHPAIVSSLRGERSWVGAGVRVRAGLSAPDVGAFPGSRGCECRRLGASVTITQAHVRPSSCPCHAMPSRRMEDFSPSYGSIATEWAQGGITNGMWNSGSSSWEWFTETISWCDGYLNTDNGGYTSGNTYQIEVENLNGGTSYSCGTGGAHYVHPTTVYLVGSAARTVYWTRTGSAFRVDANLEFYPGNYYEPMGGNLCLGGYNPGSGCLYSAGYEIQREDSNGWSDWSTTKHL